MARHIPLRRELPNLHRDGSIKFRDVLRQARAHRRANDRDLADARRAGRITGLPDRVTRLRTALASPRIDVAADRAFWAVTNVPVDAYELRRVEAWGHAWYEAVYVAPIAPAVADLREAA